MEVKCLQATPIMIAVWAGRTSHNSGTVGDKEDLKDAIAFLKKLTTMGHTSVLEHIIFSFHIQDLSRAALQELARHRMSSMTVKSTRFTLKKTLRKYRNMPIDMAADKILQELFMAPEDITLAKKEDEEAFKILLEKRKNYIKELLQMETLPPNDILKYFLPESLTTELVWTINLRSYLNFLHLRLSPKALREMQELASRTTASLPVQHKALVSELYSED